MRFFLFLLILFSILFQYSLPLYANAQEGGGILEVESASGQKQSLNSAQRESMGKKRIRETLNLDVTCVIPGQKDSRSSLQIKETEKGTLLFESAAVNIVAELKGTFSRAKKPIFKPTSVEIQADVTAVIDSGMKPLGSSGKISGALGNSIEIKKNDARGRELYRLYIKVTTL